MTTRTETALSERELAAIEARHPLDRQADADYRYMGTDAYHVGCDAARLLAALTAERAARGQVEAAARAVVASEHGQAAGRVDGPDPAPEDFTWYVSGKAVAALRAALAPSTTTPEATKALAIANYERLVEAEEQG